MGKYAGEFVVGILWVAAIFVLVRPGSQGPSIVTSVTSGTSNLVKAATGGGTWSSG
jgi:hypothetical protein